MTDTTTRTGISLVIYGEDEDGPREIDTVAFGDDYESAEEQIREATCFLFNGYSGNGQLRFGPPNEDGVHINIAAISRVEMRVTR